MKRKIKFRVWNEEAQRMYCEHDIIVTFSGHLEEVYVRNGKCIEELVDYKLMQYIGLKDIKGIEIYENDIVKIKFLHYTEEHELEEFVGVVKFYDGSYWIDNEELELAYPAFNEVNEIEVLGNIYKNLELLS